jgi:putative endonuclease
MNIKLIKKWEVYIIETESGTLYTGITNDLDRRFANHLNGDKGAKFFRFGAPKKIVFRESHSNRSEATKREIEIKKMSKSQKLALIKD